MTIQPINDNVVVKLPKVDSNEEKSKGGLILPNTGMEVRSDQGEVVAIGDGKLAVNGTLVPLKVAVGNHIIFNRFAGTEIISEDEKYLIIKENDILAIVK